MSIVSFPQFDTRAIDITHSYVSGSFTAASDSSSWAPLTCASLSVLIAGNPYPTPNDPPCVAYRNSTTDWGWTVQRSGFYSIDVQVLDLQATTLPTPPSPILDYSLGVNGAVDTTRSAKYKVRFAEVDDMRTCIYRACGQFVRGDTITPGSEGDIGSDVVAATRIDAILVRYRE